MPARKPSLAIESPTCAVDASGVIVAVNRAWVDVGTTSGGDPTALGPGADYLAVCDAARDVPTARAVADGLRGVLSGSLARFELDYPCHGPGRQRWCSLQVSPQVGAPGAVLTHHDVSLHDRLTDLPNQLLLIDRLEQALAEGSRRGHLVAVASLGPDGFSRLNADLGRSAGDAALVEIARRLSLLLRDGDTLARSTGDRFVVVLRDLSSADEAQRRTERLAQAFAEPFLLAGRDVLLTAAIGVSLDRWAQPAQELLDDAHTAMEDAKRRGPGEVLLSAPGPDDGLSRLRTEVSLRTAIYRGELVVHYQPVVDLAAGIVTGVEALVRWQHPADGLLPPETFIPVAESGGLIVALGAWVLEEACAQGARWHAEGLDLDVAVNLSTRQVAHPDLLQTLVRVLEETGLDPGRLVLEVTESVVMEDAEVAAAVLGEIAALGVSLAIDDFGTGYSSLVYLKRYPIAALKVDRSFVAGMGQNEEDNAIVASVVGLARAVGGSCIAEGVETTEQYTALWDLQCSYGQGWLFGRAVPPAELPALAAECEQQMTARLLALPPHPRGWTRDDGRAAEAEQRRDQAASQRDEVADQRDRAADQRDDVAGERDRAGDERDQAGDQRDRAAELRDRAGEQHSATTEPDSTSWARRVAARERRRASQDRETEAGQRGQAEQDRWSATASRSREAEERTQAELERSPAMDLRTASELERDEALAERASKQPTEP